MIHSRRWHGQGSGPTDLHFEYRYHTSAIPYKHHDMHCSPSHLQPIPNFLCIIAFDVDTGSEIDTTFTYYAFLTCAQQ